MLNGKTESLVVDFFSFLSDVCCCSTKYCKMTVNNSKYMSLAYQSLTNKCIALLMYLLVLKFAERLHCSSSMISSFSGRQNFISRGFLQ